jgi:hypothetical protein
MSCSFVRVPSKMHYEWCSRAHGAKVHTMRPSLTSRYFTEGQFDPIAVFAGLIQTAIYADFGYIVSSRHQFFSLIYMHRHMRTVADLVVCHKVC